MKITAKTSANTSTNTSTNTSAMLALWVVLAFASACDRNTQPFVPGEQPQEPDLSAIFPAGAERAARPSAVLPPPPGRGQAAPPATAAAVDSSGAPPIRGSVQLAPELSGQVPAGAVLFLIARGPNPGPPLAVEKIDDLRFPIEFSIGPEDRMIREMPFVGPVTISARIDADGNATTRVAGDLQGAAPGSHQPGATGVTVVIDEFYPASGASPTPSSTPAPAADDPSISGTIALAPELAGKVPNGSVLFLIARTAAAGPPLAVQRIAAPQFPLDFSIGPNDRMIQSMPFAGAIQLSARIDADANAMSRTAGDLFGSSDASHAPGDRAVRLTIDEVVTEGG